MNEDHSPNAAVPRRSIDLGLNAGIAVLLIALLGLVGWFGYNVWGDYQRNKQTNAPTRVIAALQDQVRKSPNDVILRVRLGEALGAAGKYADAVQQLNAALKIDPKHIGAHLDLGMIAMLTDKEDEAERYFTKVIELTESGNFSDVDERRENAYYNLGVLKLRQEEYEESAGYLKGALRIRKDASDTYVYLARALRGLEDYDGAIQNLEIAVSFDPGFAEAWFLMGQLYQEQKDDVNASACFRKAAELEPDADLPQEALAGYGPATDWISRAEKSLSADDIEAALSAVLVARNLDSKSAEAAKLHGEILIERGDTKDALEVYLEAQELAPKDAEVKAQIATLEESSPKVALAVYQSQLKEDPTSKALKEKVSAMKKAVAQ